MSQPVALRRARRMRWAAPLAVSAVVAAIATGTFHASADTDLPPRSAAQLLADVSTASVPAFEGTVVEKAALGLPDLPAADGAGGSDVSLFSLLTGSHTAKIWYGGPRQQRVALLDTVGETDVFHNGSDVWQWDSNAHSATHLSLPAGSEAEQPSPEVTGTLSPDQLAQQALNAIDPTTAVSIDANRIVAGQKAYELVLQPRDTASRVGSVRIAIDGSTKLPLGVQVFGRGDASNPALDVSFTSISYSSPDASMFAFSPPAGATVSTPSAPSHPAASGTDLAAPQTLGSGWTSIAFVRMPDTPSGQAQSMLRTLPQVSGTWGTGRLLDSSLLSALITSDGRAFFGPVDPSALYAAAETHR